ncbi:LPXTG cell wall anchor domain-containing protein [Streptococcus mutans]|uniref:LPXTG cell wall anchor domain-containing protein n=1 Tax=Streptococcus mutans TaxID=1309 RepID=UPI0003473834|nr:LPXTG cell wall anchor domain-containing protein [Streptococcus mutans]
MLPKATTASTVSSATSQKSKQPSNKRKASHGLPSTGEDQGFILSLLGLMSISVAGVVYYRKSHDSV